METEHFVKLVSLVEFPGPYLTMGGEVIMTISRGLTKELAIKDCLEKLEGIRVDHEKDRDELMKLAKDIFAQE